MFCYIDCMTNLKMMMDAISSKLFCYKAILLIVAYFGLLHFRSLTLLKAMTNIDLDDEEKEDKDDKDGQLTTRANTERG